MQSFKLYDSGKALQRTAQHILSCITRFQIDLRPDQGSPRVLIEYLRQQAPFLIGANWLFGLQDEFNWAVFEGMSQPVANTDGILMCKCHLKGL